MASHVVVIDTSFRRVTIKVTPGKYLTDVLEEACTKFGIKSSNYGLKNNNKPVDLSRTFRQTGLSSGAKLELVVASRTPTAVSVALQLPPSLASTVPGGRLTDKVPSDTTLWLILRKFESGGGGANLNFTARGTAQVETGSSGAGRVFFEQPVLNIMGRELATFVDLQKTLAQLGFNGGSTLIRLDFKMTDQPLEEAMEWITEYFRKQDAPAEPKQDGSSNVAAPQEVETVTDAIARLPSAEPTSLDDTPVVVAETFAETPAGPTSYSEPVGDLPTPLSPSKRKAPEFHEETLLGPEQRPIAVYSAPSNLTPKAALTPHNDDDYEPTIAHAKLHQSRLLTNSHNKRLPSDAETEQLENEKAAKLANTKSVDIKIRFPDQSSIVSPFNSEDTGAKLYSFVTDVIVADDQPFKLVWTSKGPPQTVPNNEKKLIKDLKFEGRMLVNFSWEDGVGDAARKGIILQPKYAQSAKEVSIPELAVVETKEDGGPSTLDKGKGKESDGTGKGKGKGMPAWLLKGLKKK